MKKKLLNIGLILGALLGVLLLFFPHISFMFAGYNQSYVTSQYDEALCQIDEETLRQIITSAEQYNENLKGDSIQDPFLPGSGKVLPQDYLTQLNVNGVMGYVRIPKINVDLPIYHGTSDETLQKGVGHLEGTSLPIGGAGTHSAITGHTGLTTAKMFTDLGKLELGDEFYICVLGETRAYRIDQIKVVEPDMLDDLKANSTGEYVTLITCTPYSLNTHRLLVRGVRVPYTQQEIDEHIESTRSVVSTETILLVASVAALIVLVVLIIVTTKRAKKNQNTKTTPGTKIPGETPKQGDIQSGAKPKQQTKTTSRIGQRGDRRI